jgi:hypothetical protein
MEWILLACNSGLGGVVSVLPVQLKPNAMWEHERWEPEAGGRIWVLRTWWPIFGRHNKFVTVRKVLHNMM